MVGGGSGSDSGGGVDVEKESQHCFIGCVVTLVSCNYRGTVT